MDIWIKWSKNKETYDYEKNIIYWKEIIKNDNNINALETLEPPENEKSPFSGGLLLLFDKLKEDNISVYNEIITDIDNNKKALRELNIHKKELNMEKYEINDITHCTCTSCIDFDNMICPFIKQINNDHNVYAELIMNLMVLRCKHNKCYGMSYPLQPIIIKNDIAGDINGASDS